LFELERNDDEVNRLISITKSDSGISGPELAKAHMKLGELLAEHMSVDPNDATVVAMLRGGVFFAEGIYFKLGCRFQLYDPKHEEFRRPDTKNVILVDSVINTGKTIRKLLHPNIIVACCVINENAVSEFQDYLYTVRVSRNSFVGSAVKKQFGNKGPDTTMRLFNLISQTSQIENSPYT
jgi:predicted phosphoribosyltransferase